MKTPHLEADFEAQRFWPPVFLQPAPPPPIIAPITVCIAAICENGKTIVLVADRLITFGNYTLQIDGEESKIVPLSAGSAVAATGTSALSELAVERLSHSAELMATAAARPLAERMQRLCAQLRIRQIERELTRPFLNMSFAQFASTCSSVPTTQVVLDASKAVQGFKFLLTLIVASVDAHGAHLYQVTHDALESFTSTGFTAVGCGSSVALSTMATRRKLFKKRSLPETVYSLFALKKAAESVPGVGLPTDVAVVRLGEATKFLDEDQLRALSKIYKRMQPPELSSDDSDTIGGFFS